MEDGKSDQRQNREYASPPFPTTAYEAIDEMRWRQS